MFEFSAAISSARTIYDTVRGIASLNTDVTVKLQAVELLSLIVPLQASLLEAQAEQAHLRRRIEELEAQLAQAGRQALEQQDYQLATTEAGGHVYRFARSVEPGAPTHDLCVKCFDGGTKSVLQPAPPADWYEQLGCPSCGSKVLVKRIPMFAATTRRTLNSGL